jgi:hypothetical protein
LAVFCLVLLLDSRGFSDIGFQRSLGTLLCSGTTWGALSWPLFIVSLAFGISDAFWLRMSDSCSPLKIFLIFLSSKGFPIYSKEYICWVLVGEVAWFYRIVASSVHQRHRNYDHVLGSQIIWSSGDESPRLRYGSAGVIPKHAYLALFWRINFMSEWSAFRVTCCLYKILNWIWSDEFNVSSWLAHFQKAEVFRNNPRMIGRGGSYTF